MTRATDILRERARMSEECIAAYGLMSPQELRAVAELMEANVFPACGTHKEWCLACDAPTSDHAHDCTLAVLERAIEGESNADR